MTEAGNGAPDDVALVREVAAGSEDALGLLYDRHVSAVFATASRLTSDRQIAEEVVQETFLALWNRAELYNPLSGSLSAWLHTIARNRAVDRLRATRFGNAAADLVDAGRSGVLPVLRGGRIEVATMTDAVREVRRLSDDIIELVRRFAGVVD